jgi:multidrug transporter EmrE-like cation transporter
MNVIGLVMCVISLFFFVASGQADSSSQVEEPHVPDILEVCGGECAEGDHNGVEDDDDEDDTSVDGSSSASDADDAEENPEAVVVERKITLVKSSESEAPNSIRSFIWGIVLALVAGLLFGSTFDLPTQLMQCGLECPPGDTCNIEDLDDICLWNTMFKLLRVENDDCVTTILGDVNKCDQGSERAVFVKAPSPDALNYVLSHYAGIFLTGLIVFIGYVTVAAARGRTSYKPVNLILPSVTSGVMWGVAQTAWFVANETLSMSVAFPIISTLPGLVALLCGVLFFGELRTPKSRQLALIGVLIRLPGVLLIALSS